MARTELYGEYAGYIYDLDDTLLDNSGGPDGIPLHQVSKFRAFEMAAERYGLDKLAEVTSEQERSAFRRAESHSMRGGFVVLMSEIYPGIDEATFEEVFAYIHQQKRTQHPDVIRAHGKPVRGAREVVRLLAVRGYSEKQAIVSGAHRAEIDTFLIMAGLIKYFPPSRIIGQEDVRDAKPHPEGMDLARARMGGSDPRPYMVFEDDPKGIAAAKHAGMSCIALTTRYTVEELMDLEYRPDAVVSDLSEAVDLLQIRK